MDIPAYFLKVFDPGSYFVPTDNAFHYVSNNTEDDAILYIKTNENIKITDLK